VRLPDGRIALTQMLTPLLTAQVASSLSEAAPAGRASTAAGEVYRSAATDVVVEVAAGTTRHAVVTMIRVR
jgi:hypothetical protein